MHDQDNTDFFILTHEGGHQSELLPLWASTRPSLVQFDKNPPPVVRVDLPDLPGVFQLHKVLSPAECQQFRLITETLGYHEDAPVSLPHSVRHMANLNWVVDELICETLFARCQPQLLEHIGDAPSLGLNARFRFYRYQVGDYFKPHTDGSWPGSRAVDGQLQVDAFGDRWSQLTFVLLLSEDFDGGHTCFYPQGPQGKVIPVRTPMGSALCFPHGGHPQHYIHSGEKIRRGTKYIIRTELLYARTPATEALQRDWIY
ncbi:MAG: oxidoreductase [Acidiferrobacteraceae bacterium]|nr:oxidoreductase [Acidiferrobacteraceae bacterium]